MCYLQVGVVRSAKSIIHHLFNLALYKSSFSHTANSPFIMKICTVSNESRMSNIKQRTVAKFTSSASSAGFISLHLSLARQPLCSLIFQRKSQTEVLSHHPISKSCSTSLFMIWKPRIPADTSLGRLVRVVKNK